MDICKKILSKCSSSKQRIMDLGVNNPLLFWSNLTTATLDTSSLNTLFELILSKYQSKRFKFLTIRPHDLVIMTLLRRELIDNPHLLYRGKHEPMDIISSFQTLVRTSLISYLYPLLKNHSFVISCESNDNLLDSIHIHLVVLDMTCSKWHDLVKLCKCEYDPITSIMVECNLPTSSYCNKKGYAVYPKQYKSNERINALMYYMGFDKVCMNTASRILKKSYRETIYHLIKNDNKYLVDNLLSEYT